MTYYLKIDNRDDITEFSSKKSLVKHISSLILNDTLSFENESGVTGTIAFKDWIKDVPIEYINNLLAGGTVCVREDNGADFVLGDLWSYSEEEVACS